MTIEETIKAMGKRNASGDYIAENFKEILPDSAEAFGELAKRAQEANYGLVSSLQTLADKAAKLGLTLDVEETRPGTYEVRYLRPKEAGMSKKEIEAIISTIPKFTFSVDSHGIIDRYGMKGINQGVMDARNGLIMAYTKNEQTIIDQINRLNAKGASSYAAKAVAGDDRMYKKFAHSIKYTANKTQGAISSAGAFYAQDDEARKAFQGTGSKQSLLVRRGYFDMSPLIRELTADKKELHKQYVYQTKRFGADYLKVQDAIEQDVMELMTIASQQLNFKSIMTEFEKLRHGSKYEYLLKNAQFQKLFFQGTNGQKGLAEQLNSLHPYIGTSQEGSVSHKLMSFVKNSDLGILGGLDDPSSRKRVQVANILSYQNLTDAAKKARAAYTKKGVALTKAQASFGINGGDPDQRLFGEIYASLDEIEQAQKDAVDSLYESWAEAYKNSSPEKEKRVISDSLKNKMIREFEAKVGRYSGAHSGGVFYNKEIERSLDATMQRYIRISEEAIKEREDYLRTHQKEFAVEKGEKLSDLQLKELRTRAVRDVIARETNLGRGGAHRVILGDVDDVLEDIGNGMFGVSYAQASNMKSGNKILTGNEYDRLTAAGIDPIVIRKIIERRMANGSLKYSGTANDYIKDNAIALIKQADKLTPRNFSGQLEGYVNAVLDYARQQANPDDSDIFKDQPDLKDWLTLRADGTYVVNKDVFSGDGEQRKKATEGLINAINGSKKLPEWLKNVFQIDNPGNTIQLNTAKYLGLTTANQFHDYDYGAPGKTVQTDYRWAGAARRGANIAQMATGVDMSGLRKLKEAYREGDEKDRKNREKLKRLQDDQKRMNLATHRTAYSDFSFKANDLVLSYSPIAGRKALTYSERGQLVYADTNKPYKGGDNVYLDLNGPYKEIEADDYDRETGGIIKSAFDASVYGALAQYHAIRGDKAGDMYYAPGNKGFVKEDRNGNHVKGRYLALPSFNQEDWQFEDHPGVMMVPSQFGHGLRSVMRADEEYLLTKNGLDPLNPDRKALEDADLDLQEAMIGVLSGYYDDVNSKDGTFYKAGTKTRVHHSMMGKASSSSVKDISGTIKGSASAKDINSLDRLLSASVLANSEDLRDLLRREEYDLSTKEGQAEYETMLRGYLDYMYGDGTESAIADWEKTVKGKKRKGVLALEDFLLESVTIGSDVFEKRLEDAKGDFSKIRGLGGEFARFPLSNGLDVKDAEVFAGKSGIAERGTIKVGLGLGRQVNADFDGDKLVLHMDMAEKAGFGGMDRKALNEQKKAAVDLQRDIAMAVALGEAQDLIESGVSAQEMKRDDVEAMYNDQAQQSGAIISRLNKASTGLLSNNYQALAEMMDYLDLDITKLDPSNTQAKKNAVQQMAIRNIFESFTQDAISSKKVSSRLAKQYSDGFETDIGFLSDLRELMDLFRAPETYQSREGLDTAFKKAIDMKIFNAEDGKSPMANRIMAGTTATAQKLFTDKDGTVDIKSMMEIFGVKDEETMRKMLFDFSGSKGGVVKGGELPLYFSIDQLKDFMWDFEQKNPGKLAWEQRSRNYLPGHLSARSNIYKTISGAALTKEEYDSLSPEMKELCEKYDALAESAGAAKDAINAEAAAEQAKIKIAGSEGDAVGKLTKKYDDLNKSANSLSEALEARPNFGGKSVSALLTDVFGDHFTTDTSGFEKVVMGKIGEIKDKSRTGSDKETEAAVDKEIKKLAKNPIKALGYTDKAIFEEFSKAWVPTVVGRISDSIEQGLIAAMKANKKWGQLDYAKLNGLEDEIEKTNPELHKLLIGEDGVFKLISDYRNAFTLVFGKREGTRILKNAILAGEGMTRNTLAMAGGNIDEVGQSEGTIIGLLAGRRLVHGRFDRLTFGNADQKYVSDLTGEEVTEPTRFVTVSDKKYAARLSDQYIAQQMAYVRSLEQIRDWGLAGPGGAEMSYEEFLKSDLASRVKDKRGNPLDKKSYYSLLGYDTSTGDELPEWKRVSKGAAIASKISVMNKKTGMAETYNIGRTYRDKYTGKMKTIFGVSEEQSKQIESLIAAGVPFDQWDASLQEGFKGSARVNTNPEHNFKYAPVYTEKEKKAQYSADTTSGLKANLSVMRHALAARDKAWNELNKAVEEGAPQETVDEWNTEIVKQQEFYDTARKDYLKDRKEYDKLHPRSKRKDLSAAEKEVLLSEGDLDREAEISRQSRIVNPGKKRAETRNIRLKREAEGIYNQGADIDYQLTVARNKMTANKDPDKNQYYQDWVQNLEDEKAIYQEQLAEYEQGIENSEASYKDVQQKIAAAAKEKAARRLAVRQDKYLTRGSNATVTQRGDAGFLGINNQIIRWIDRLMMGGGFQKLLQLVKSGMSEMVKKAKELDAAMTNLRIVTGDSSANAKNMMSQYSKLAKELGATTTEVTSAATEWLRQGYETAEVTDLITASMYLSKLGMIDSTTATKDLTSAMKGFKIEASDAMDIVDKLTSIDLEAATSAGEIAEGLAQFSNMATLSGVDIDQAAAYVATIADVTQSSGSTVGNAMKTIISRYGNVKAGAYNTLNVDDETTDVSESLNDVEKVLHKLGISIRDSNLEFKDFDEVLDEIAGKWDALDNVSKKAIANAFAGTRQQEAFTTLMENYDKYQDLLETSQNSSGTADMKYKSYKESYQAAQQTLTAAFEGLVNNTPLNNMLTELTKIGTSIVELLNKIMAYVPNALSQILSLMAMAGKSPLQIAGARLQEYSASRKKKMEELGIDASETNLYVKMFRRIKDRKAAKKAAKNGEGEPTDEILPVAEGGEAKPSDAVSDASQTVVSNTQTIVDNAQKVVEMSQQVADNAQKVAEASAKEEENKKSVEESGKAESAEKSEVEESGKAESAEKDRVLASGKAESVEKQSATGQGVAPKTKAKKKSSLNGVLAGAQIGISGITAGITGAMTGQSTHLNDKGEEVNSSEEAKNRSKTMSAMSGMVSAIPIIGWILSTGFTHIARRIAQNYDKYRDQAAVTTSEANANLNLLSAAGASLSKLADADLSSEEGREAASSLLTDLYSEKDQATLKLLNQYLGNGGDNVYSLLSAIKSDTASISEKTTAMRKLQIAELEAEKSQISRKYATQMYENSQTEAEQYAKVKGINASDVGAGTTAWGTVGSLSASGALGATAGAVAVGLGASGPVGWIIGIAAGVLAAGAGIVAAVQAGNAAEEKAEKERARQEKYNSMTTGEKIAYIQGQMDDLTAAANEYKVDVSEQLTQYQELIETLQEQNALVSQMVDEIDDITLQQGLLSARYDKTDDKGKVIKSEYLADMTVAQLKNMGTDEILKMYARGIEENGGLVGVNVWSDSDKTSLSDAGFDYLRGKLKDQGDEEINAVLNGYGYTLSEALGMGAKFGGQRWYEELLQSFASALDVPIDQLNAVQDKFGSLTLSEAVASTSDLSESISSYIDLLGDIADVAGETSKWMETIISQFPELTAYLGNTSELIGKIGKKLGALSEAYLNSQYDDMVSTDALYTEIKDEFYVNLRKKTEDSRLTDILDSQKNISNLSGVMDWLKTQYGADGKLNEDAQAIYDALIETINGYGTEVTSSILKEYYDLLIDFKGQTLDSEINNLTEQKEALEDINSQREYENRLIEAKLKLENASKEKKRVYRAGVGWVYEEDQEAIKEAQDALDEVENEQTVSDLEAQIAELERQKEDLESVYDKQNYETLKAFYDDYMSNNPNSDLLTSIVNGINGISKSLGEMIAEQSEKDADDKTKAIADAQTAWQELSQADPSDARTYNAKLSAYQTAASAAISAGATEADFSGDGFAGSTETAAGGKSAWEAANGDLDKMRKNSKYSIKIPDKGNQHFEGTAIEGSIVDDATILGWIFDDIRNNEGYIIKQNGEIISPNAKVQYKPKSDDDDLLEYADRLKTSQGLSDAIYVGWGVNNESVWYHNGQFYKITSDGASNGLSVVRGALSEKDIIWPGTEASVSKAAGGSYGLPGGATLVNELGTEAIITPMGTLTSLPSGTGVVPADITKNLWALGEVAPGILRTLELSLMPDSVGKSNYGQSTDESFNIANLTMNVTADDGFDVDEFVDSIKRRAALTKNLR